MMENAESPILTKTSTSADDMRNYEVFPDKKTQDKIDVLLSPYNKGNSFKRCMNFDDSTHVLDKKDDVSEATYKWQKISDFILNQKDDFLRKTLRLINKKKYADYEDLSKCMVKLKPKRSQ